MNNIKLFHFLIFIVFFVVYISSNTVGLNKKKKIHKTSSLTIQQTYSDFMFENLLDANTPLTEKLITTARQHLIEGKFLFGDAKRAFNSFPSFRVGGMANGALAVAGSIMKLYNFFAERRPFGGTFFIHNAVNTQIRIGYLWDYQMNRWHGQFPAVINSGSYGSAYVESENCSFKACEDTNATAEFKLNCNGRDVTFILAIKNRKYMSVNWKDNDAYNECYDIQVWSKWSWAEEKNNGYIGSRDYSEYHKESIDPTFVIGGFSSPFLNSRASDNPEFSVKVIPHSPQSRFPMAYSDCNFEGEGLPLVVDNKVGVAYLNEWNDKISSLRIPPGFKVMLFEHANFVGEKRLYSSDVNCLTVDNFNDKASSYLVVVDDNLK